MAKALMAIAASVSLIAGCSTPNYNPDGATHFTGTDPFSTRVLYQVRMPSDSACQMLRRTSVAQYSKSAGIPEVEAAKYLTCEKQETTQPLPFKMILQVKATSWIIDARYISLTQCEQDKATFKANTKADLTVEILKDCASN